MGLVNQKAMHEALGIFCHVFENSYWTVVSDKELWDKVQLLPLAEYRLTPVLVWAKQKYLIAQGTRVAPEMPAYTCIRDESEIPELTDADTIEKVLAILRLPMVLFFRQLPDVPETELHSLLQNREFIYNMAESIVDEHIAKLQPTIDQQARTMTTQYEALFKFENRLRRLVEHKLKEAHQNECWEKGVPTRIRHRVERRVAGPDYSWHQIEMEPLLHECDFGDLHAIITCEQNWGSLFEPIFGKKELTNWAFATLESNRNPIAHSNLLPDDRIVEFQGIIRRIEGLIQPHLPKDTF